MRQIVMITQWINFSLVIIELWAVFINMRKKTHYYLFLNGIATLIYSVGAILMHYVESEESYYIFFMFSWVGKVGAVVTTLLFCVKICDNKLPVVITAIESGLATIACVIIVTTKKTGLFYKGYYLVKEKGLTIIECEPGPWRAMWPATVIIVILTCLFMITKSLAKEKNIQKRKQYIVILMALVTEIAIGFLMELPIGRYYDFNQLGFSLCIILVVFAIFHGNFMDAETMAKDYVIDELSAGVIAMDKDEMVAYYNKKILQVFPDMILDEHGVIAKIAKSVETGEPITIQDKIYNFEERKLVQNSSDRSKLYVMIDSTKHYQHLRELEQEKQIADAANRAKSEFLASMSHEIRTPINAVLGMDEMILRECKDSTIKEYATDIQAAGNTLLTIINNILDLNKIESGKMEIIPVEYDVAGAIYHISNMIKIRAKDKNLSFHVSVSPDIPMRLCGDDVKIRQILMNLLTNAVKYTPSGNVYLRVSLKPEAERKSGSEILLHFEVEDTGTGIKTEDLDKLFREFERIDIERNRNIEGTGLGMSITYKLLSLMGSELKVESEYGKGSIFSFDLKQAVVDETPIGAFDDKIRDIKSEEYTYKETFIVPDAQVLLVDDNMINRKVFKQLLKQTQMQITEADSGYKAIELAKTQKFDIIFMDHMMPEMDGVEAMEKIKADKDGLCADTPIIVLTANAVIGSKEKYLEQGFNGYLSKPVAYEDLLEIIRENLPEEKIKACIQL